MHAWYRFMHAFSRFSTSGTRIRNFRKGDVTFGRTSAICFRCRNQILNPFLHVAEF
jgi:hypothetical protein